MSVIALISDYGTRDWFAGCIKGVISDIAPHIPIVDITHDVPAGNIRAAGFILGSCWRYFPRRSVFISVVDPGVGTNREPIVVTTKDHIFIGPNNGLFSFLVHGNYATGAYSVENSMLFRQPVSHTFHGRDIFAPVGAFLAREGDPGEVGSRIPLDSLVLLKKPIITGGDHMMCSEIVYVDHFGNAITAIEGDAVRNRFGSDTLKVSVADSSIELNLSRCYGDVPRGAPCAILNSAGFLEIAVNGGNAGSILGIEEGRAVTVERFVG